MFSLNMEKGWIVKFRCSINSLVVIRHGVSNEFFVVKFHFWIKNRGSYPAELILFYQ